MSEIFSQPVFISVTVSEYVASQFTSICGKFVSVSMQFSVLDQLKVYKSVSSEVALNVNSSAIQVKAGLSVSSISTLGGLSFAFTKTS